MSPECRETHFQRAGAGYMESKGNLTPNLLGPVVINGFQSNMSRNPLIFHSKFGWGAIHTYSSGPRRHTFLEDVELTERDRSPLTAS